MWESNCCTGFENRHDQRLNSSTAREKKKCFEYVTLSEQQGSHSVKCEGNQRGELGDSSPFEIYCVFSFTCAKWWISVFVETKPKLFFTCTEVWRIFQFTTSWYSWKCEFSMQFRRRILHRSPFKFKPWRVHPLLWRQKVRVMFFLVLIVVPAVIWRRGFFSCDTWEEEAKWRMWGGGGGGGGVVEDVV